MRALSVTVSGFVVPLTTAAFLTLCGSASAQPSPEVEACQASSLIALKERTPGLKDISFDAATLSESKADTSVGDTKIKTVIMGEATLETAKTDKPRHFVCLIGEKGKVVLTFFTQS